MKEEKERERPRATDVYMAWWENQSPTHDTNITTESGEYQTGSGACIPAESYFQKGLRIGRGDDKAQPKTQNLKTYSITKTVKTYSIT